MESNRYLHQQAVAAFSRAWRNHDHDVTVTCHPHGRCMRPESRDTSILE